MATHLHNIALPSALHMVIQPLLRPPMQRIITIVPNSLLLTCACYITGPSLAPSHYIPTLLTEALFGRTSLSS